MREIDLAWLAGIVDGEGTMGIYKQSPSPRGRGKTPSIIVGFRISNSDSRIILQSAKICERITGKQVTVNRYQSINRFPEYKISVNSQKDIFAILSAIKPYLIGKADQAEIIISVLHNRVLWSKWPKDICTIIDALKDMKKFSADNTERSPLVQMGTRNDQSKDVGSSDPKRTAPKLTIVSG